MYEEAPGFCLGPRYLTNDEALSNFAFNFNLRRYKQGDPWLSCHGGGCGAGVQNLRSKAWRRLEAGRPPPLSGRGRLLVPAQEQMDGATVGERQRSVPGVSRHHRRGRGRRLHLSTSQLNLSQCWSLKPQQASTCRLKLIRFCD